MSFGSSLITDALGAGYTPQNAVAYNPDTQTFKYSDGTTGQYPTQQPGLISRMFSPQAQRVVEENNAYAMAPWIAKQQKYIAEQTMMPAAQGIIPGFNSLSPQGQNTALDVFYGSGRTSIDPNDMSQFKRGYQNLQGNLGGIQSKGDIFEAQNEAMKQAAAKIYGSPAAGEYNSAMQNVLGGNIAAGEAEQVPQYLANRALELGNEYTQGMGLHSRLPDMNVAAGIDANTERQNAMIGNIYGPPTNLASGIGSLYQAQHPSGIYQSPFNANIDLNQGTITPGHAPLNLMMQGQMSGSMGGGASPIPGLVDKNGQPVIFGPRAVNPLPSGIGGTTPTTSASVGNAPVQPAPFVAPPDDSNQHQGKIIPVSGTEYGIDDEGHTFYMKTGQFVPADALADTSTGKAIQHAINQHKSYLSAQKEAKLPHNVSSNAGLIGNALGQTLWPQSYINPGYDLYRAIKGGINWLGQSPE